MTKQILTICVMLFSGLFLAACSSTPVSENPPEVKNTVAEPYRIGVGDTISIHVWRNPELSQSIVVRPDGYISMPLMGDVAAEGMEPELLAAEIKDSLGDVIRNPEVTVMVTNPVSAEYRNRVRVTGQVGAPLTVAYRQGMTVLDLVLEAGGLSDFAAEGRAILHRKAGGEYKSYELDLDGILNEGRMATNYTLQPGDVISVPRKQLFRGEL